VRITGVDISSEMNKKAREKITKNESWEIELREENILDNTIKSESGDFVISTFGIKTFSKEKQRKLAIEINRILRKGGQISIIEISKPKNILIRIPYMFYLKNVIPIIGRIFMGNSLDYRMLGIYCENFTDCSQFKNSLEETGMTVRKKDYFFGCATGIVGCK
jgi:Methylase involved in ubiquinone/menaquinone biosynthesis